jgi:DNA-binding transcriptional ArsR family regulator
MAAFTRRYLYSEQEVILSSYFFSFAHPARSKIIQFLSKGGSHTAGDIAKMHPISKAAVSQHLKILRDSLLVDCWEKCPFTYYKANKRNIKKAKRFIKAYLNGI